MPFCVSNSVARQPRNRALFSSSVTGIKDEPQQNEAQNRADTKENKTNSNCYYKNLVTNKWQRRLELKDLAVGQELPYCYVVQELLGGATGPKVFVECGVASFSKRRNNWRIVNGMLRLGNKQSAAKKRVAKLREKGEKKGFSVYVTRTRLGSGELEVSLTPPSPEDEQQQQLSSNKKRSLSSFELGEEVTGTVLKVEDYGAFIDAGANHHGLLHIQRVADLFGCYIDKRAGLVETAGLEPGSRVKLQVASLDKRRKRLALDFTDATKAERQQQVSMEEQQEIQAMQEKLTKPSATTATEAVETVVVDEEEAAWAAYDAADDGYDGDEGDEDDDYDEDRDIEDALGLGTY